MSVVVIHRGGLLTTVLFAAPVMFPDDPMSRPVKKLI